MSLVIDASVAAKWVLDEDGSDRAFSLRGERGLIAPSLVAAEIGSAIWKIVRRGAIAKADALVAINSALLPFDALVPNEELRERALALAIDLDHPIYDCFYLALAERERAPLVSADARLNRVARRLATVETRAL